MIPYSRPNALIYIPYPRVNCLKTIPFTAAHTYIPIYGRTPHPPPPPGGEGAVVLLITSNFFTNVKFHNGEGSGNDHVLRK